METNTHKAFNSFFICKVFLSIVFWSHFCFTKCLYFSFLCIYRLVMVSCPLCKALRFEPAFDNNVRAILFFPFIFAHWLKHELGAHMSCIKIQYSSCNMQLYYYTYYGMWSVSIRLVVVRDMARQHSRAQYQFSCC